ncbi:hypothetical protein Aeqsu_0397 [Aequorivita sublithincola DSM 14238]|uniref:Secretion system C-terminal sorting domain-containing protein n=1 Tax=Aequorivita sublithincola (strain DSM 14238 / LMG 21431 / ACAM 643 / 9-3) TaxID=746697 RepID=I3YSE2_AEQSU|nr:T9SS type A sorting domain-containing protein [Aequorivita sublithincola]AFL79910.1 hypothetical protein Aeqsu_0397 [Aequorivita sublithincola DSM 14238]
MIKKYLIALLLGVFTFSSYAQYELFDDFEFYNIGPISVQAPHWRAWSGDNGGLDDAIVLDVEYFSGLQSLYIEGLTDILLLIQSTPTSNVYAVQFNLLIPGGKSGYFNMQAASTKDGIPWNGSLMGGNVFFNCDGASPGFGIVSGVNDCTAFDQSFSFPEDQWFKVDCIYNLDAQTWDMYIDDIKVIINQPFAFGSQVFVELAAIEFASISVNNQMYIDDVVLGNPQIGVDDFTANKFSVYPNPVKDMLSIKSANAVDNVTVYDILGKVVLQENPEKISPAINMSGLASGSYLVKVTIGNNSKTVKILK